MISIDTGFMLALVDSDDQWHSRAAAQVHTAAEGWVTTWPVLTEACWLFQSRLGQRFAAGLMDDVASGGVQIWDIPSSQLARLPRLMRQYADLPMDLADATLVLLAEHLGHGRILSTDQRDFGAYRWKQHEPFHNLLA
jgi:predicted nucleic acid-binding protein